MNLRPVVAAALGLAVLSCHKVTEEMPARRAPTAPSFPVVIVPVSVPTATPPPTSTPTPNPNGTPNPNPTPTPAPPSGQSCGLGPGSGSGNDCPLERPSFLSDVEAAIDDVIREQPGLFDLRDSSGGCGNCYRVLDSDRYWAAVTAAIQRRGLCATNDGEELAVKNTNAWNDQYDIITGSGYVRRQLGAYRSTCYPAWF